MLEVPDAKSSFSINSVLIPLHAASKAMPQPVIPPPITTKSKWSSDILLMSSDLLNTENDNGEFEIILNYQGLICQNMLLQIYIK